MVEIPLPFIELLSNNMRSDINGFYCRHSSCTKKFVNSQSRSRHEKNCQYRSDEQKTSQAKEKTAKPINGNSQFYDRISSSFRSKYADVAFESIGDVNGNYSVKRNQLATNGIKSDERSCNRHSQNKVSSEDFSGKEDSFPDDGEGKDVSDGHVLSPCLKRTDSSDETLDNISVVSNDTVTDETILNEYELPKDSPTGESQTDYEHSYRCTLYPKCEKKENELFCISLVDTLDKLDSRKQRLAKVKIQQLLYDLEYSRD